MNIIDKLAWICIKDKRLLLARSKNKVLFYLPGGKRELGESDNEALSREINEELSVNLINETIELSGEYVAQADEKNEGVKVKLTCYTANYIGNIKPDSEIEEVQWLEYSDVNKVSEVTKAVMKHMKYNLGLIN